MVETTIETSKPKVGELVPRPDGRGALRYGGSNKGGPGATPDALKAAWRCAAAERLPRVLAILDDPDVNPDTVIRGYNMLATHGIDKVEIHHNITHEARSIMEAVSNVLPSFLDSEQVIACLRAIGDAVKHGPAGSPEPEPSA